MPGEEVRLAEVPDAAPDTDTPGSLKTQDLDYEFMTLIWQIVFSLWQRPKALMENWML